MKIFMTIWVTAVLTGLELIAGNMGLALGLPIFGALYFAVAFFPEYGIAAAGAAGILLDAMYDRSFPFASLLFIFITMSANYLACRGSRDSAFSALGSGCLCGLLIFLGHALYALISGGEIPGPDIFSMAVFQISGGGLFMLFIVWLFDAVNKRSDLPCFVPLSSKRNLPGERKI